MQSKPAQTMAGLFAAKEAVVKALGIGFSGFWPCDVEICHDIKGKPYVRLHNKARKYENHCIAVSISHTKTDAVAFALAMKINPRKRRKSYFRNRNERRPCHVRRHRRSNAPH
jgi:phosphopantetheine--protein transferase-like protein